MFKVGDRVKRIESSHWGMEKGFVGTVTHVRNNRSVRLLEYGEEGKEIWHANSKLIKVSETIIDFLDALKSNEDNYYV